MSAPIEFYFDFASPYGYLASESVDALGERHGRSVVWHALVLDANFQSQDRIRIPASAMRSDYVMRDTERLAAYMGLPYKAPSLHSLHTELAARIFQWLNDRNPAQAKDFAHGVYRAYFVDDQNIAEAEVVAGLAESRRRDETRLLMTSLAELRCIVAIAAVRLARVRGARVPREKLRRMVAGLPRDVGAMTVETCRAHVAGLA